jgi:competence protein ComEA
MDRIAEWRPVEPAGPDGTADDAADEKSAAPAKQTSPRADASWPLVGPVLIGLTVIGFVIAGAIALVVLSSVPKSVVAVDSEIRPGVTGLAAPSPSQLAAAAGDLVIDVEGAIEKPGVWRLPVGSRVGDAIAAAGGYSAQVDIDAATALLNLAAILVDGQQIRVPILGEVTLSAAQPTPAGSVVGAAGGLINVNTASADELDTLPGIGPVTAEKIIAARQEAPFASIDELDERDIVGASTLEKIRALITVGP